uniref:Cytochrome P450 n=1 Tax=Leersia perrieri TaxID=77586 RepID=A0A0D9WFY8_9ORYZ
MATAHLAYVLLFLVTAGLLFRLRRLLPAPANPTAAHCPHPNPVLGNTVEFIRNRRRFFDWYAMLLRDSPPGPACPADVEHLLRGSFGNYVRGPGFRVAMSELIGDGLFAADGRLWKLQRKVASHAFSSRALRRFSDDVLAVHLRRRLIPFLDAAAASGDAVDLQDALRRFAFDAICHVAFGVEAEASTAAADTRKREALFAAFDAAVEISFRRALTPPTVVRKVTRLLNVGASRRLRDAVDVFDDYAMSVVESKESQSRMRREEDGDPDLLSRFMAAMDDDDDDGEQLGAMFPTPQAKRRLLRDVVVGFVLAGKDTTSSALTWLFWLLAANPRCERRVRDELDGDAKGMQQHYLHAAIAESMRLYPPVPFNGRVAVADDVLPCGAAVRAGWFANYSAYAMGRMEKIWGENCLDFSPERWLRDRGDGEFVGVEAARYPVFHLGPRVCLGKEMAYVQMKTVAAAVLRRFSVEVMAPAADMGSPPAYEMTATMKMKGGLWVRLRKRE